MVANSRQGATPKGEPSPPARAALLGYLADMGDQLAAMAQEAGAPSVALLFVLAGEAALQACEKAATEDAA